MVRGPGPRLPPLSAVPRRMALPSDRIAEDLRGQVSGDVLHDDVTRRLYATDGSLYEITPAVVVRPRMSADVEATVR